MRTTGPMATRKPLSKAPELLSPVGMPEYVLVLRQEWERVMMRDMVQEGIRAIEDPNTEWISREDFITGFAAPNLARHRKAKGLTQKQLGVKMGVPQSQIARMERDPESVTYKTLKRVAKALGMSVTGLLA